MFHDDFELPDVADVGETCVTVTWLQFNAQLLRLTGEARFAEQLERTALNQLFGGLTPLMAAAGVTTCRWKGGNPYSSQFGRPLLPLQRPCGIALIPTFAVTTDAQGLVVNLYEAGTANCGSATRRQSRSRSIRSIPMPARSTSRRIRPGVMPLSSNCGCRHGAANRRSASMARRSMAR